MDIVRYEKVTSLPKGSNIKANTLYFLKISETVFEFYISDNTGSSIKTLSSTSSNNMFKSVYDLDDSGVVDNTEALQGQNGNYYLNRTNHIGTQPASTISNFDTEVSNNTDVSANTAKNSYPTSDANKLAGIEDGAEVNIKPDWTQTDGTQDNFIKNKPPDFQTLAITGTTFDIDTKSGKHYYESFTTSSPYISYPKIANEYDINVGDAGSWGVINSKTTSEPNINILNSNLPVNIVGITDFVEFGLSNKIIDIIIEVKPFAVQVSYRYISG